MNCIVNILRAGGRLQLFYKPLVVWWIFERAWKCAAMCDSQNGFAEKCAVA